MIDMLKRSGVIGLDEVPEELQPWVSDTLCDYFGKLNYIDSPVRSKENIATSYPYHDALVSKIKEEFNQYRRVRSTVPLEVFLDTLELPEENTDESEPVPEDSDENTDESEPVPEDSDDSEDLSGLFEDKEPNPYPKHKFVIASVQVEDDSEEESFDYCESSDDSSDNEGYSDEESDEDEEFDYCASGDESEVSEDSEEVSDEDEEEFDGFSDEISEESYEDSKFNYEPLPQRPVVSTPSEPSLPPEYQEIVAAEEAFRSIGSTASKLFSKVKGYYSE